MWSWVNELEWRFTNSVSRPVFEPVCCCIFRSWRAITVRSLHFTRPTYTSDGYTAPNHKHPHSVAIWLWLWIKCGTMAPIYCIYFSFTILETNMFSSISHPDSIPPFPIWYHVTRPVHNPSAAHLPTNSYNETNRRSDRHVWGHIGFRVSRAQVECRIAHGLL